MGDLTSRFPTDSQIDVRPTFATREDGLVTEATTTTMEREVLTAVFLTAHVLDRSPVQSPEQVRSQPSNRYHVCIPETTTKTHSIRLRHTSALSRCLGQFRLSLVIGITLIDRQIMLLVTHSVLDTGSLLNCSQPLPPTSPDGFIFTSLPSIRHTKASFEVVKYPQT